jgi:hypothetical protein
MESKVYEEVPPCGDKHCGANCSLCPANEIGGEKWQIT